MGAQSKILDFNETYPVLFEVGMYRARDQTEGLGLVSALMLTEFPVIPYR